METYPTNDPQLISEILQAVNAGTPGAEARLLELVLNELRRLAATRLHGTPDCSLSPSALVNEAYLKLFGNQNPNQWDNRAHFFGSAAHAMRQILIDHARSKRRQKRGGERLSVDLDIDQLPNLNKATSDQLLDLHSALEELAQEDPHLVRLVELKFFAGQTTEEAAQTLQISPRTAHRRWQYAKARLWTLLSEPNQPPSDQT